MVQECKLERLVKLGNMALLMRMLRPPKQRLLACEIIDAVDGSGTKVSAAQDMAVLAQMAGPLVDAQLPSSDAVRASLLGKSRCVMHRTLAPFLVEVCLSEISPHASSKTGDFTAVETSQGTVRILGSCLLFSSEAMACGQSNESARTLTTHHFGDPTNSETRIRMYR